MTNKPVLLVGAPRLTAQIAYVLDLTDYATAVDLTQVPQKFADPARQAEVLSASTTAPTGSATSQKTAFTVPASETSLRAYQIIICYLKRKSRYHVKNGRQLRCPRRLRQQVRAQLRAGNMAAHDLCFLEDLGAQWDAAMVTNDAPTATADIGQTTTPANSVQVGTTVADAPKDGTTTTLPTATAAPTRKPWLVRILRNLPHPVRAWGKVRQRLAHLQMLRIQSNNQPLSLLLRVLVSPPIKLVCSHMETDCQIWVDGTMRGCCSAIMAFGNIQNGGLDRVYNSPVARIIKLSSLNRSYCFCDLAHCNICKSYSQQVTTALKPLKTASRPRLLEISTDKTCNLSCPMCRQEHYLPTPAEQAELDLTTQLILQSGWLEQVPIVRLAGMGEVFYSPHYQKMLASSAPRRKIEIITNGLLFNQENWQKIKAVYRNISIAVSIDAATPETYKKLRGANFDVLMRNLELLASIRQQGALQNLTFNFVVQRDNYREMADFVRLAKRLHADSVYFTHLNYACCHAYSYQEYLRRCMLIDQKYLAPELYQVLQDPLFADPMVDLFGLEYYLRNTRARRGTRQQSQAKVDGGQDSM